MEQDTRWSTVLFVGEIQRRDIGMDADVEFENQQVRAKN
jgi:hypothetical protein